MPLHGELHIAEHLCHRTAPRAMYAVKGHLRETTLRDNTLGLECLELGTIGTSLLSGVDEPLGLIHATVEVASDLGNEIRRIVRTYHPVSDLDVFIKSHIIYFLRFIFLR